ncbi:MAG: DUF3459 domain-containing protein [Elusimicrobia bacterium]|nr:DUF3459 domain-containing protein [Elusimicrobiota bacterium]
MSRRLRFLLGGALAACAVAPQRAARAAGGSPLPAVPGVAAEGSRGTPGAVSEPVDGRDQVVYFLMTDRFADGDPANNDQKAGEFNPADGRFYSGGDLAGVRSKLDYLQDLGATAVWITPPVANVWYDPVLKMAGYHGYWAADFKKVDAHLGTLEDYRGLSSDLHRRGMLLIQDIVTNHTGDFFSYQGPYDPADPAKNFRLKAGMVPSRPTQHPFSMNDAGQAGARRLAAYHWTPDVADFNDEAQLLTHQVSGLDDLDTGQQLVRRVLRGSYDYWIEAVGVDGFRIDTARYVEHDFWRDFLHSTDPAVPGVEVFARRQGKEGFLTFGEVWTNATPFADKEDVLTASYLGAADRPEMRAVLNFPLALELRAVFAKGAPPARLKYRLESMNRHYAGGRASVNFIDNHDMPRFLSESSEEGLIQALAALFTIPGMPVVYAGTEVGLSETRGSMFAGGFGSGGRDHFDRRHPLYGVIKSLAALRRAHPALRRGALVPLDGAAWGAGPLAYRLDLGEERLLVLFNTADEEMLLAHLETGLAEGTRLEPLFSRGAEARGLKAGVGGRLLTRLPARSTLVLKAGARSRAEPERPGGFSGMALAAGAVEPQESETLEAGVMITRTRGGSVRKGKVTVEGSSAGLDSVSVIVDGRLGRPIPARVLTDERWVAELDGGSLPDGEHSLVAMGVAGSTTVWSPARAIPIDLPFVLSASVEDPVGDDKGPTGTYRYPLAPGFQGRADIQRVQLFRRGSAAKLVIKLANGVSDVWNPAFGFDHVCFDVYVDLPEAVPGRKGQAALPRLHAGMKGGGDWDFAAFLAGWKVGLYSSEGAAAEGFGPSLQPAPRVKADKKEGTVEVELDLHAFKGAPSFDGARFYVTAWDYDGVEGKLRPLAEEPAEFVFGGGEPDGPRIMDDTAVFPEDRATERYREEAPPPHAVRARPGERKR